MQLGPQRALGSFRVLARVEDEREEPCARHVPEEAVAEALALAGAGDQARNVGDHEGPAVDPLVHDPELGREGGEGIVADPGTRGAKRAQQRGLPGVGQADESHIGENLELQADLAFLPRQTPSP